MSEVPYNHDSHARRSPASIARQTGTPSRGTSRREGPQRTENPVGGQNVRRPADSRRSGIPGTPSGRQNPPGGENYRFTAGNARQHSDTLARPAQNPKALVRPPRQSIYSDEERRLIRQEEREERRLERKERNRERQLAKWEKQDAAESAWQKGIVRVRSGVDRPLLILALVLLALGSVTVLSASYPLAVREGRSDATYYAWRQVRSAALGLFAMFMGFVVPYERRGWRRLVPIAGWLSAAAMLVAVFFMGIAEGEAQRWIAIPGIGFTIQPSEIMKVALVMILALYADAFRKKREESATAGGQYLYNVLLPTMILGLSCGLVIIGKHLSGTMIIGAIGFFMILTMMDRKCPRWWAPVTIILLLAAGAAIFILLVPYARTRFLGIIHPGADVKKDSWQSIQSLYAVGSGGLFGVGVAQSRQKFAYLAAAHTDFIFAIWCEEFGFIGAVALIALFFAFLWRGFRIAAGAKDKFTMLTAYGITTHLAIQVIGHMVVDTTYINTGISLPFFSYGGSSLLVQMFEVGMLLRISQHFYRSREDLEREAAERRAGLD